MTGCPGGIIMILKVYFREYGLSLRDILYHHNHVKLTHTHNPASQSHSVWTTSLQAVFLEDRLCYPALSWSLCICSGQPTEVLLYSRCHNRSLIASSSMLCILYVTEGNDWWINLPRCLRKNKNNLFWLKYFYVTFEKVKLDVAEMWFLRRMCKIKWMDRVMNEEVLRKTGTDRALINKYNTRKTKRFFRACRVERWVREVGYFREGAS